MGIAIAFGPLWTVRGETVVEAIERLAGARSRIALPEAEEGATGASGVAEESAREDSRYRLTREIGRGGEDVVFEARDKNLGRAVALKVLLADSAADEEAVKRFVQEAQLGGQLQHPGIVPVYGLGLTSDRRPYFAMKLVKGDTVASVLEGRGATDEDRRSLLGIFEQVCQAVAYAHARGVIHCDLQPANLLVGAFGEVLVIDWGRARVLGREEAEDERTDVHALGAILYQILTGALVSDGPQAHERLDACGADEELVALAKRCLDPEREARPRDAAAVAETVSAYLTAAEERARREELRAAEERGRAERARLREGLERKTAAWERRARRYAAVIAALVLGAFLVGGGGYALVDRADRARMRRTSSEVSAAMNEAEFWAGEEDWARALGSARQAVALARAGDADDALLAVATKRLASAEANSLAARERAEIAARDDRMCVRVEGLRMQWSGGHRCDRSGLLAEYAAAFREYGIDVERLRVNEAVRRIRACDVTMELAAALDDWSWLLRREDLRRNPRWARLVKIAREADPDEWRNRFRDLSRRMPLPELRSLAATADVGALPPWTLVLLARHLGRAGDRPCMVKFLRRAWQRHPGDYWLCHELAFGLANLDRFAEAQRFVEAAIALRPAFTCLWCDLGTVLARRGRADEALRAHRRAAKGEPDHAWHHHQLGRALEETGDVEGAIGAYRAATTRNRRLAEPHAHLARILTTSRDERWRDPAVAVSLAERAVKLQPGRGMNWRVLGMARYRSGQPAAAIEALRRAITVQGGGTAHEWLYLAMAHRKLGQAEQARSCLGKGIAWLEEHALHDAELARLRAEAEG
ncbi:MAG: protein kinase domain-containing protein [Planctomycetota bacterium]